MRLQIITLLLALVSARATGSSEQAFDLGMKAVAIGQWDSALGLLENALAGEPDNLRYGSEYRQAILSRAKSLHPKEGQPADFERSLNFFEQLVAKNPNAGNAFLNYGFAYVDKIPAAGAITQVMLANTALSRFSKSIEIKPTWINYYTRGASYLFWPKIFGRAKLGVADLEEAVKMQKAGSKKLYHARAWVMLGDGYWKTDDLAKARSVWAEGLSQFPENTALKDRLAKQGDDLKAVIDDALDPNKRVDTNLKDIWTNP